MKVKLVIWDLDNTLWGGSIYYKDKDAVKIKRGTKEALKELDKRGILSSICSKNYYEDAHNALEKFGILKYFKHPQISWKAKSEGIKKISELLNIRPDEMIFIDDDAFQRAEVESQIPGLRTMTLKDPLDILNLDGITPENPTEEDKRRVEILKEQINRQAAEEEHSNYYDFLLTCEIKMRIREIKDGDWERATQLLNRTNELNATNNGYTIENLKESYYIGKRKIFVSELSDKFGDYGLIGIVIIDFFDDGNIIINDLAVSCRTMGRGVGTALVTFVLNYAKKMKVPKVLGYITETESNWRMKPLFEKRKFKFLKEDNKKKFYEFDVSNQKIDKYPIHLTIKNED